MKKAISLVYLLLILCSCDKKVAKDLDLELTPPKNWIEIGSEEKLFKEIYKDSATSKLEKSKKIYDKFRVVNSYFKYDSTHYGINPTIQIQIHDNPDENFQDFQETVVKKGEWIRENLEGYQLLVNPEKITIDGVAVVYFQMVHNQIIDGVSVKIRSRIYMIPNGDSLYQLTFNDCQGDDCSTEFEESIKSIKLVP